MDIRPHGFPLAKGLKTHYLNSFRFLCFHRSYLAALLRPKMVSMPHPESVLFSSVEHTTSGIVFENISVLRQVAFVLANEGSF